MDNWEPKKDDIVESTTDRMDLTLGKRYSVLANYEGPYIVDDKQDEATFTNWALSFKLISQVDTTDFATQVAKITSEISELLIAKNKKYGNSALEPIRVFSKASAQEQLLVRLDDKLSRLCTQHISEDEDVLDDLLGYLILLKIANTKEQYAN